MSAARSRRREAKVAPVFAALGDVTRLQLLTRLGDGEPRSIKALQEGFALTRQAVTKHLHVLRDAGLVERERVGRESRFALRPRAMRDAHLYLERASAQWDDAIDRLRDAVEG